MNVLRNGLLHVRDSDVDQAFHSAVEYYSRGKLSFESDKFVAFAGIAKYLSEEGRGSYIAGLWRHNLELHLLWKTWDYGTLPVKYRAPSWSWMAIGGVEIITHLLESRSRHDVVIQILDICIKPRIDGDVFGQIDSASLTIWCRKLKRVNTAEDLDSDEITGLLRDHGEIFMVSLDTEMADRSSHEVFLLHILTSDDENPISRRLDSMEGLLLRRSTQGLNFYERIGQFLIYSLIVGSQGSHLVT